MKIGISGAKGSFSEEAARVYAVKEHLATYDIDYLVSVENVLHALTEGTIERAVFPIENSNGGIVIEAVHAMAKYTFEIEKLFEIDVHHMLLVKKGVSAEHITHITSHDQALKQCRMYLKRKWPGIEISEYADTAKAAADLASGILPDFYAVIAPKAAATLYDLDILEESIQDLKYNYTSFIAGKKRGV